MKQKAQATRDGRQPCADPRPCDVVSYYVADITRMRWKLGISDVGLAGLYETLGQLIPVRSTGYYDFWKSVCSNENTLTFSWIISALSRCEPVC